jgi:hypothetical protein
VTSQTFASDGGFADLQGSLGVLPKDEADIQTPDEKRSDRKALSPVRRHVAQQYLPYIQTATHAKEAWDILSTLRATSLGAKKSLLEDQLTELTKEKSEDIAVHCGRAQKLRLQLLATGESCSDSRLIRAILRGLPEEFSNVREVLMYQTNLTVDRVLTHMQNAEERIYAVDKVTALKARTSRDMRKVKCYGWPAPSSLPDCMRWGRRPDARLSCHFGGCRMCHGGRGQHRGPGRYEFGVPVLQITQMRP